MSPMIISPLTRGLKLCSHTACNKVVASRLLAFVLSVTNYKITMFMNKSKYNSQKLAGYPNKGLHLDHPSFKGILIPAVENPAFTDYVYGCKVQKLSHQGTASFGDAASSSVFAGTDLIKIESCKFLHLRDGVKFTEIANLSNETGSCDLFNSLYRKDMAAVRDFFKRGGYLFFKFVNKLLLGFYGGLYFPYLKENTLLPILNAGRHPSCIIN